MISRFSEAKVFTRNTTNLVQLFTSRKYLNQPSRLISTSHSLEKDDHIQSSPYKQLLDIDTLQNGLLDVSAIPEMKKSNLSLILQDFEKQTDSKLGIPIIPMSANSPNIERLAQFIAFRNLNSAVNSFEKLYQENSSDCLKYLSSYQCHQFLSLFPLSNIKCADYWPVIQKFSTCMELSGHKLSAEDYSILLECSFKSHDYQAIEGIWLKAQESLSDSQQTTHLWNTYIMATTNSYPKFWKQWAGMKVPDNNLRMFKAIDTPLANNDAVLLLAKMFEKKVYPNHRTYELVILYLFQKGDLEDVRSIIWSIWHVSSNHQLAKRARERRMEKIRPKFQSSLYPGISTITSIINGFCLNGRLNEGLIFMNYFTRMYKINISNNNSKECIYLWSIILRWAYLTEGRIKGAFTSENTFENIWNIMIEQYKVKPNDLMYRLRGRYYSSKNDFNQLIKDVPEILQSNNKHKVEIASLNLKRAVKGYAKHGYIDESIKIVNEWSNVVPEFEQVREYFVKYVNSSSMIQKIIADRVNEGDDKIDKGYDELEEGVKREEKKYVV